MKWYNLPNVGAVHNTFLELHNKTEVQHSPKHWSRRGLVLNREKTIQKSLQEIAKKPPKTLKKDKMAPSGRIQISEISNWVKDGIYTLY